MKPAKPKSLKKSNRKTILNFLRSTGETTVNDIHNHVGLSKTTVMKIINYYLENGLLLEKGKGDSTGEGGKKPLLYTFNEKQGYAVGIHMFPNEVYIIVTDLRLSVLDTYSFPITAAVTSGGLTAGIVKGIYSLITALALSPESCIGIAVGAHGITNFGKGTIHVSPHFPALGDNVPLKELLGNALRFQAPIYVDNQIRFQAFAEQTIGIAKDKKNIIVIEGGEGLVAGIIVKNEIKRGVHYIAGEIGHMVINPYDEEECSCGGNGCFETQVSTNRLMLQAEQLRHDFPASPLYRDGILEREGVSGIFRLSDAGDEASKTILGGVIHWFAIGLSNLMLMHDPEMIVFQGVYAEAGGYFITRLREEVNTTVLTRLEKNIEIQYSKLKKDRGAVGGAAFAIDRYFAEEELYTEV
jgi:predicted NBD/HSP70 family sugar kinase